MTKRSVLFVAVLAVLLLWPASLVLADDPDGRFAGGQGSAEWQGWSFDDGQTYMGEDVTISSGQVVQGSLGVFDGDLIVEDGGIVRGDVFVSGGDAHVAGRIDGGLAVIGGDLTMAAGSWVAGDVFGLSSDQDIAGHVRGGLSNMSGTTVLRSSAIVDGDVLGFGENVQREPGAQVGGQLESLAIPRLPFLPVPEKLPKIVPPEKPRVTPPAVPEITVVPPVVRPPVTIWRESGSPFNRVGSLIGRVFSATFSSLLMIGIGALVVVIWPRQTQRVSDCLAALPLRSLGLGLLSFLIAIGLEVVAALLVALIAVIGGLLSATIILLPLGVLLMLLGVLLLLPVPLALVGAVILGWVALAELVGGWVLRRLRVQQPIRPLGAVVVGLVVTVWLPALLSIVSPCCIAWPLVVMLVTSAGLGAVMLTRFGTRACFPPQAGAGGTPNMPSTVDGDALPSAAMDAEAGQPDVPPAG